MSVLGYAVRLVVIDLLFLVILTVSYLFIEFGGVEASEETYTIIQLTALLIVGTLGLIGAYVYFFETDRPILRSQ